LISKKYRKYIKSLDWDELSYYMIKLEISIQKSDTQNFLLEEIEFCETIKSQMIAKEKKKYPVKFDLLDDSVTY